ncbi:MAG: sigma-70 family RNA polymerase sigma factor [Chloroflexi bacterium]|nr:sigma-70 family RNA polymerase sigma factor [Chloroflexota bacterium]
MIQRGDAAALAELYDRYARLVYNLALKTVGDSATAEEITQDVFFRIWEKAGQYRAERARVSTWLSSIARNRAIDILRRRNRRGDEGANPIDWTDATPEAFLADDDPEREALHALRRERVRAALKRLPETQREVLALAYFEGLSHSEMAERLNLPLGTVKTRVRLAMQKLRVLLVEEDAP